MCIPQFCVSAHYFLSVWELHLVVLCSVSKLALGLGYATVEGCRAAEDNGLRTVLLWFIWGYSLWYLGVILGLTDGTRRHSVVLEPSLQLLEVLRKAGVFSIDMQSIE